MNIVTKFSDLEQGDWFVCQEDNFIYMRVFGHNLPEMLNEGNGGNAVIIDSPDETNLSDVGLICYFHNHENIIRIASYFQVQRDYDEN